MTHKVPASLPARLNLLTLIVRFCTEIMILKTLMRFYILLDVIRLEAYDAGLTARQGCNAGVVELIKIWMTKVCFLEPYCRIT